MSLTDTILSDLDALAEREHALLHHQLPDTPRLGHGSPHTPALSLASYRTGAVQPLRQLHRGLFPGYTDVLGNSTWGDCGEAMTLHGIEGLHHAAGTPIPPFVTNDALNLYSAVMGFNQNAGPPGENPTDQGTDNNELVAYWKSQGVKCGADGSVHKIVGSLAVDLSNPSECRTAVYEFGALFIAVALPLTAQGARSWAVVGDGQTGDSAPGSWGGHDVVALSYGPAALDVNTWGTWLPAENDFLHTYGIGAFVVITQDMLNTAGDGPSGINWAQLQNDLNQNSEDNPA